MFTTHPVQPSHERGDLLLRGLFTPGTDCIIDVSIIDLNAPSYRNRSFETVLKQAERNKKRQYLKACHAQRRDFAPFIVSTDGVLAPEAHSILNHIAQKLALKWQQPYSTCRSYLSARFSITLARACNRCLRGSRLTHTKTSFPFKDKPQGRFSPPSCFFLVGSDK